MVNQAAQQASIHPSDDTSEVLRLRGEIGRLRLKSWATRAAQLKQRLEHMPDKSIPEHKLLTDKDWLDAIKDPKQLETDADFRQGLKNLRDSAKIALGDVTRDAGATWDLFVVWQRGDAGQRQKKNGWARSQTPK